MHPPFSPRGENGPCTVQKTRQEGDFGLPLLDLPFKRHKAGAAAPSLETPPNGAAAGLKVRRFDKYPGNLRKRHNLRHKRGWTGALQRTRIRRGKIAESWLSTVASPNLPGRASLDQAISLWAVQTLPASWQSAKRTGPFGPALRVFRKDRRTYLIRSPAASLALISFTASL